MKDKKIKPELFKKVHVHSEDDLPKDGSFCYYHLSITGEASEKIFGLYYTEELAKLFLNDIDWYLLPIESELASLESEPEDVKSAVIIQEFQKNFLIERNNECEHEVKTAYFRVKEIAMDYKYLIEKSLDGENYMPIAVTNDTTINTNEDGNLILTSQSQPKPTDAEIAKWALDNFSKEVQEENSPIYTAKVNALIKAAKAMRDNPEIFKQ